MAKQVLELTEQNFTTTIAQGLYLVDFYATWCAPCRMIAPIIEELAGKVEGKAKIAKVDIDHAQQVAQDLGITSIPTLILFKDGAVVKKMVGVKTLHELQELIENQA